MAKQFVSQLRAGDRVESCFVVASKQLVPYSPRSSKVGQEYLKIALRDKSGIIEGRIWENASSYTPLFEVDDIVLVKGVVCKYNGLQIAIHKIERVPVSGVNISDFIPTAPVDTEIMWEKFKSFLNSIENPHIRELLNKMFSNKFKDEFCAAPGGRTIHHAYRGGLLEHTIEVATLATKILELYKGHLDKDILVAGALLHDIGKTLEYDSNSFSFQRTDRGKLHGHLILGRDLFLKCTADVKNFPLELEDELGHMILSHHGYREWGSPEQPKTVEALALFYADLTSARLSQAVETLSSSQSTGRWSKWNSFLERSFLIRKPVKG